VSPSTVTRIEAGEIDPTVGTLERVLAATGVSLAATTVPVSDPSAVVAVRSVLDPTFSVPKPAEVDKWAESWARAGYLLDGAPTDWPKLARVAARSASLAHRPGAKHFVRGGSWWAIANALSKAGVEWAATGGQAAEHLGTDGPSPWPVFYVTDVEQTAASLGLRETAGLVRTTLLPLDGTTRAGTYEDSTGRWADPLLVVIDCLAGSELTRRQAEQVIDIWLERG